MAQHIKIPETKIITKNGETTLSIIIEPIVIEVNINGVNTNNNVEVLSVDKPKVSIEEVPEKTNWAIQNFENKKIKFGN